MWAKSYPNFVGIFLLFTVLIKGDSDDDFIPSSSNGIYKGEIQRMQVYNELSQNETFIKEFNVHTKKFQAYGMAPRLHSPCIVKPALKKSTQSVHQLQPHHVKVVGALGDSITKALAAKSKTILTLLIEYIGISWSVGGDKTLSEVVTLPNILKSFNGGNIQGFSAGQNNYFPGIYVGSHLNLAKSAGKARDVPYQAELLVRRIKSDKNIDFYLDWKVITLFIGGNDICDCCIDKKRYSPENYKNYIEKALDILHKELPRTFVNVVLVPNIVHLREVIKDIPLCKALHIIECKCVRMSNEAGLKEIEETTFKYQELVKNLIDSGKYHKREDFTVEIQPFLKKTETPYDSKGNPDMSYFAPDCFHFSERGHQELAIALWNNMFEPVNEKTDFLNFGQNMTCPTEEQPYFATWKNSLPASESLVESDYMLKVEVHGPVASKKLANPEENTPSRSNNKIFQFSLMGIGILVASIFVVIGIVLLRHKLLHKKINLYKEDKNIIPVVNIEIQPKF